MTEFPTKQSPLLSMRGIVKDFAGVRALAGVDFDLRAGEVHALCGENGAGKSTLIKTVAGVFPPGSYSGKIMIDGNQARFHSPREAEDAGVAVIHQELVLVPEMTVAENIFLGREPSSGNPIGKALGAIDRNRMVGESKKILESLGLAISPATLIGELTVAQRQLVEIAKALAKNARILILDEPTSALAGREIDLLHRIVKDLRGKGVGCVYISHRFEEVFDLADRITVLRDGRTVGTRDAADTNTREIIAMMVGREISELFPKEKCPPGETILRVSGLTAFALAPPHKPAISNISFEARRGEILGIAGLMGSGRTELLSSLFGAWPGKIEGSVEIKGQKAAIHHPREALQHGLALVSEDRKRYGLHLEMTIRENSTLAALRRFSLGGLFVQRAREASESAGMAERLQIKASSLEAEAMSLSGGNQQKVVLAKWLLTEPDILLLDEPTRGIDVGAKSEIHRLMTELKNKGMAIVMVSSELPEILGMSDRILVMRDGRIAGELSDTEATQEKIMSIATAA